MDAHPIKWMVRWLDREARSITPQMTEQPRADTSDLKQRIAAGEYRLDAHAIAEAMFGAADRALAAERRSEVFEAGDVHGTSGGIDQF